MIFGAGEPASRPLLKGYYAWILGSQFLFLGSFICVRNCSGGGVLGYGVLNGLRPSIKPGIH